eukprot:Lithocolla_globosa_v1_NODE_902_length_3109_cov_24.742960.p3 type:complete len:100 gc:universal NODE_902_length_3109_cov_24.742960:1515-1216(-)
MRTVHDSCCTLFPECVVHTGDDIPAGVKHQVPRLNSKHGNNHQCIFRRYAVVICRWSQLTMHCPHVPRSFRGRIKFPCAKFTPATLLLVNWASQQRTSV